MVQDHGPLPLPSPMTIPSSTPHPAPHGSPHPPQIPSSTAFPIARRLRLLVWLPNQGRSQSERDLMNANRTRLLASYWPSRSQATIASPATLQHKVESQSTRHSLNSLKTQLRRTAKGLRHLSSPRPQACHTVHQNAK